MFEYGIDIAIFIDLFVLSLCIPLLLRYGRLTHSHPLTIYLFFHLLVVTSRLLAIAFRAPTLFSSWGWGLEPVTQQEIVRAALLFDVALILSTLAASKASRDDLVKSRIRREQYTETLQISHIKTVIAITLPVGIVGLVLFAQIPGVNVSLDVGAWNRSTWLTMTATWAGLALIGLIYCYGFRPLLVILMGLYLFIMVYQGYHRFRVMIPILLLTQIYLDRRGEKWPRWWTTAGIGVLALLFFPLKHVGRLLQEGTSFDVVRVFTYGYIEDVLSGRAADQQFLDMFASALTLTDYHGQHFYGMPYLKMLLLPIPRPLWPGKPSFADYMFDISTSWRPMGELGMIVTYLGEAYINFWYVGIVLIPIVLTYLMSRFYYQAYRYPYRSIQRFTYLLFAANLIQLYRDGLTAIVIFVLVSMMPLTGIVVLHWLFPGTSTYSRRLVTRSLRLQHDPAPGQVHVRSKTG